RMQGPNGRRENRKGPPPPLDEPVRQKMAKFAGVAEVYPDVRFPAELRLSSANAGNSATKPITASSGGDSAKEATQTQDSHEFQLISGLPMSARQLESFDNMKGKYFSAPDAAEVILQSDEAKTLADKPEDLLGKDIVLRYASRHLLNDDE